MPPPVRSFRVGAGKKFAIDAAEIGKLRERFKEIKATLDGDAERTRYQRAAAELTAAFWSVAAMIRDKAFAGLVSSRYPNVQRRLQLNKVIFAFATPQKSRKVQGRSSLAGVRTGADPRRDERIWLKWGEGKGYRRRKHKPVGSVAHGGFAVSMAHIFNRGTQNKKIKPTRFFHNAVWASKVRAVSMIKSAYQFAVGQFNK